MAQREKKNIFIFTKQRNVVIKGTLQSCLKYMKPLIKIIKMVFSLILCVLFHAFKNIFFFPRRGPWASSDCQDGLWHRTPMEGLLSHMHTETLLGPYGTGRETPRVQAQTTDPNKVIVWLN